MTHQHDLRIFLSGVMTAGYWVAALFFFRYWRRTRDQLFMMFAIAFVLLGVQRIALTTVTAGTWMHDTLLWPYVVRLIAFVVILWAIVNKNRSA